MVNKCFAPNCSSGNTSCKYKCSIFRAPKDEKRLILWRKAIPRADRILTQSDFVCEKHFNECDIIKEWISDDGSLKIPLKKPRLQNDAVPSIFLGCPKYFTISANKRRPPVTRLPYTPKLKKAKKTLEVTNNDGIESAPDVEQVVQATPEHDTFFDSLWNENDLLKKYKLWTLNKLVGNQTLRNVVISKIDFPSTETENNIAQIVKQIVFNESYGLKVYIRGKELAYDNFITIPKNINDFYGVIKIVDDLRLCEGGPLLSSIENITVSRSLKRDIPAGRWRHRNCLLIAQNEACCMRCKRATRIIRNEIIVQKNKSNRIRQNIKHLSKRSLYSKYKSLCNKQYKKEKRLLYRIEKLQSTCNELQRKYNVLSEESLNEKLSPLNLSVNQKLMIEECVRIAKCKSKKGRRYTGDWLMTCLLLNIKGPKVYNFLRLNDILPLPCISTIRKYLGLVNLKCGLDERFFKALSLKFKEKTNLQKHGMLIFDEMSIRKSLNINVKTMKFNGITDFGDEYSANVDTHVDSLADHALVFMYTAIGDKYAQPVAVYASKGPTKGDIIAKLIIQVIIKIEQAGGFVDGIICDGATTNRKMWTEFGICGTLNNVSNKFTHPLDASRKIYMMSDVPHLFKCIRNRLHDQRLFKIFNDVVKWEHYEILYNADTQHPAQARACPKISHLHLFPTSLQKMRVRLATQIFSNSVCHGLELYKKNRVVGLEDCEATINFTKRMNDLFDVLDRKRPDEGININSTDFEIIDENINWLDAWESEVATGSIRSSEFLTPSTAQGLRVTLHSTRELCRYLLTECGFKYVLTAKINQDVLERFFGMIRQAGAQNDHPTLQTFLQLYRLLSIYKLLKPPAHGNCSIDVSDDALKNNILNFDNYRSIFENSNVSERQKKINDLKGRLNNLISSQSWEDSDIKTDHDYSQADVLDCIIYHLTGFVCKKLAQSTTCFNCKTALTDGIGFSVYKESNLTNIKTRGYLTHPNINMYNLLRKTEDYFSQHVNSINCYELTLDDVISNTEITFPCIDHKYDIIAYALHYYIFRRMKHFIKQTDLNTIKSTAEKRKLSRLQKT